MALIAELRSHDIKLHLDEGKLKVSAPKGAMSDELLNRVRAEKAAITAFLLEMRDAVHAANEEKAAIQRRAPGVPAVASFAQQRLWFIDQLDGPSAVYNMPVALRIRGMLKRAALIDSVNAILARHDVLRTTFVESELDGALLQVVADVAFVEIPISVVDPGEVAGRVLAHARRPFDLRRGPLTRVELLQVATDDHVLLVNMHHIASDGWSMGLFVHEFAANYNAFALDRSAELQPLALQYADFAHWQREWLQGPELSRQIDYWKNALASVTPLLELPTDKARPALRGYHGATSDFALGVPLSDALERFAKRQGASLFMTLLAVFHALMARYSGQNDIAVGSPIANRSRSELEGLIGFFANTLVLRARIAAGMSFRQLLNQVRDTTLAAYEHQDLPFEQLVEIIKPQRSMRYTPLFQVMFAVQNNAADIPALAGLNVEPILTEGHVAKFDLNVSVEETADGVIGSIEYSTDLFELATIQRLQRHFVRLIEKCIENPDQDMASFDLMSTIETAELVGLSRGSCREWDYDSSIHGDFEAQAGRAPDSIALVFEDEHLSYAE
ncbi:MAG: condensation domain-containing protein, partial [Tahibacter sp.]